MNCLLLTLLFASVIKIYAYHCDRTPEKAKKPANRVETSTYVIEISGNPKSYVPGENYTITLKANQQNNDRHRFTEFTLLAEAVSTLNSAQESSNTGRFGLFDPMIATFSTRCPNTVLQTNTLFKSSISVWWVAPQDGSACLAFKATVFESPDSWFSDDDELTKVLCREEGENEDEPGLLVLGRCCACSEAKYEVMFKGMWSRNTHPKDYPTDIWRTKFSEIIGASHKLYKSFWAYGGFASSGLKQLAESGNTEELEKELKNMVKTEDIRTIIKARGLHHPNITGTSLAHFRADQQNHLVSIVSKLIPSPDWIVGVANLELCTKSCDWANKTVNLYPWDAGTRAGLSYSDDDGETNEPIKKITSNNPNRDESPFFDPDGEGMKPLAKLTFSVKHIYDKECLKQAAGSNEEVDPNCATTEWTEWSPCTHQGFKVRQRFYIHRGAERHCQMKLVETDSSDCQNEELALNEDDERCKLGDWSEWSGCSTECGKGVRTRDRTFVDPQFENACANNGDLQETEDCDGAGQDCPESEDKEEEDCSNTSWQQWSACSVTCGKGVKERLRTSDSDDDDDGKEEQATCSLYKQTVECYNPPCGNEDESTTQVYGLSASSQVLDSNVRFTTYIDGPVVDCKVTKWSIWSQCQGEKQCKKGYRYQERHIQRHAQNGGKSCPKKLLKKKRCHMPCPKQSTIEDPRDTLPTWGPSEPTDQVDIDCLMDGWSAWSPCSSNCGGSAVQIRTRGIKVYPRNNGRPCGERKQTRKCPLPISCSNDRGNFNFLH